MKALVTGASSGMGRDMAKYLYSLGYELYLVARNKKDLNREFKGYKNIHTYGYNLIIEEECVKLYKELKDENIDILINNAGFGDAGNFTETSLDKEMDMTKYSLKDLALYFEKFDGYICEIKTDNRILKFMFDINSFPHLIGLHHAFKGKKNRNEYKGAVGFEKIKNGEITYNDIMKGIKNGRSNISWVNIKNRIKYLPMF